MAGVAVPLKVLPFLLGPKWTARLKSLETRREIGGELALVAPLRLAVQEQDFAKALGFFVPSESRPTPADLSPSGVQGGQQLGQPHLRSCARNSASRAFARNRRSSSGVGAREASCCAPNRCMASMARCSRIRAVSHCAPDFRPPGNRLISPAARPSRKAAETYPHCPRSLQSGDHSTSLARTLTGTEGQAFDPRITPSMTPRATPAATVPLDCGSTAIVAASPMAAAAARTVSGFRRDLAPATPRAFRNTTIISRSLAPSGMWVIVDRNSFPSPKIILHLAFGAVYAISGEGTVVSAGAAMHSADHTPPKGRG
jgi:hypothetical protein